VTEIKKKKSEEPVVEPPTKASPTTLVATSISMNDKQKALETIRPSDGSENAISLPRIIVTQSLSQEVTREEDPLKPGLLFNRLTKEVINEESGGKQLEFIPLMYFPQRIRIELGAGLRCRSVNLRTAQMLGGLTVDNQPTDICSACKLKDWPKDRIARGEVLDEEKARRGPECAIVENFPALLVQGTSPDDYELIILSFQKTSIQAAKDLRGNHAISGKDWFELKYKLVVVRATGGPKGDAVYFKQEIRRGGKSTPEEVKRAREMVLFLAGKDVAVEVGDEEPIAAGVDPTAKMEKEF
jgi:hypothetical protein